MKRKNINAKKTFVLVLGILTSCAFPAGVVATVLGATAEKTLIMVLGLVLLVVSFFALPFVWIAFGSIVTKSKIYNCIVARGVTDVNTLGQIFGKNPQEITNIINALIAKGYLDYTLLYNEIEKPLIATQNKCPNCGAFMLKDDQNLICPYCQSSFKN